MNKRVSPVGKADGTTFENLAERVKKSIMRQVPLPRVP